MSYIIAGVMFVAIFALVGKLMVLQLDGSKLAGYVLILLVVMFMSFVFYLVDNTSSINNAPCVRWETRSMLVGKVMTPYRVCVERGEWITEETNQ